MAKVLRYRKVFVPKGSHLRPTELIEAARTVAEEAGAECREAEGPGFRVVTCLKGVEPVLDILISESDNGTHLDIRPDKRLWNKVFTMITGLARKGGAEVLEVAAAGHKAKITAKTLAHVYKVLLGRGYTVISVRREGDEYLVEGVHPANSVQILVVSLIVRLSGWQDPAMLAKEAAEIADALSEPREVSVPASTWVRPGELGFWDIVAEGLSDFLEKLGRLEKSMLDNGYLPLRVRFDRSSDRVTASAEAVRLINGEKVMVSILLCRDDDGLLTGFAAMSPRLREIMREVFR